MITDLERAEVYHFKPSDSDGNNLVYIGGVQVMNQIDKLLTDDDVIAQSGVSPDYCILIVKMTRGTCEVLVQNAVNALKDEFDNHGAKNKNAKNT